MAIAEFKNFSFSYNTPETILKNINLEVLPGEFVIFCGPSGSGKTTLLSSMKKEIRPQGQTNGKVLFKGMDIINLDDRISACEIGFLFQNPDDQIVSDTVLQELAFPLENIGLTTIEIRNRIAELATFFGLDKYLHQNIKELSGGQKQLVNLASLLVLKPDLLLLDEPTSQLDPISSYEFLSVLRRLNEEFSITIMATEHRIDSIFPLVDKVVFLEEGRVKYVDKPRIVCSQAWNNDIFKNYIPSVSKIHFMLSSAYPSLKYLEIPLSIREGRSELALLNEKLKSSDETLFRDLETVETGNSDSRKKNPRNSLISCEDLWFGYHEKNIVLKGIYMDAFPGEFISIIGGNGVGKTTLLQIIAGILKPKKGRVDCKKGIKMSYIHQNPLIHFEHETVGEELFYLTKNLKKDNRAKSSLEKPATFKMFLDRFFKTKLEPVTPDNSDFLSETKVNELVKFFNLEKLLDYHPYDCSGGEQQKIVIIKSLLKKPDLLLLDEPTKGLDPVSKINLANKLKKLQNQGLTIIMTTHDISFAAEYSERCIMLFDGTIQIDKHPQIVFSRNNFYTTFVNRMVQNFLPDSITLKDVKEKWIL